MANVRPHSTTDGDEEQAVAVDVPAPHVAGAADTAPTLTDAFYLLCTAMAAQLVENVPDWQHAQEIQAWMQNAGEDANGTLQKLMAWRHAVQLLERVLGHSLSQA